MLYFCLFLGLNQPVVHLINVDKHSNSYVLKCHVEGHGDIAISWFRDEELLERTPHIDWQRRRLFIKHATPAENGIYACGATNKAGSIVSTKNYRLKLRGKWHECLQWRQFLSHKPAGNGEQWQHDEWMERCTWMTRDGSVQIKTGLKGEKFLSHVLWIMQWHPFSKQNDSQKIIWMKSTTVDQR